MGNDWNEHNAGQSQSVEADGEFSYTRFIDSFTPTRRRRIEKHQDCYFVWPIGVAAMLCLWGHWLVHGIMISQEHKH